MNCQEGLWEWYPIGPNVPNRKYVGLIPAERNGGGRGTGPTFRGGGGAVMKGERLRSDHLSHYWTVNFCRTCALTVSLEFQVLPQLFCARDRCFSIWRTDCAVRHRIYVAPFLWFFTLFTIFKTMGCPGLGKKSPNFGPFRINPKSLQTSPETARNQFSSM